MIKGVFFLGRPLVNPPHLPFHLGVCPFLILSHLSGPPFFYLFLFLVSRGPREYSFPSAPPSLPGLDFGSTVLCSCAGVSPTRLT